MKLRWTKRRKWTALTLLAILAGAFLVLITRPVQINVTIPPNMNTATISYLPIGDSYTIGLGVPEQQNWPNLLVNHLRQDGVSIELISQPAVSGYTVHDVIIHELPLAESVKPDLVTVLVGANDQFSGTDPALFHSQLIILLDRLEKAVPGKKIVLLTLPDYTVAPVSKDYSIPANFPQQIMEYNRIIREEAQQRNLVLVDLYPLSRQLGPDPEYFISDGLHPSTEGYREWEKVIYPAVVELLNK